MKEAFSTWRELNEVLLNSTEKDCNKLLESEKSGEKRIRVMLRIHSRMNKMRAENERKHLQKIAKK
jgi:hypothetical protein